MRIGRGELFFSETREERKERTRVRKNQGLGKKRAGEGKKKNSLLSLLSLESSVLTLLDPHTIEEFLSFTFFRLRVRTFT